MKTFAQTIVGEIVAKNYATAMIFTKYGIDFCCKGSQTIETACQKNNVDVMLLQKDIEEFLKVQTCDQVQYNQSPLDELVDLVQNKHHKYIYDVTPIIQGYLAKICKVHGNNHPELFTVTKLFNQIIENLMPHMQKEETEFFPYVKDLAIALKNNTKLGSTPFGKIRDMIPILMAEHVPEGERMQQINELTNNYTPPKDACNTYKATYASLQSFEQDLHLHIHLENNIIFKRALEDENKVQFE